MIISKLITEVHENNKKKGWWDDAGENYKKDETLVLVISELSEAIEANRKDRRANINSFRRDMNSEDFYWKSSFEEHIKDTIEDELADAFIRLCDIAGGFGHSAEKIDKAYHDELKEISHVKMKRFSQNIFYLCKTVTDIRFQQFPGRTIGECLAKIKHISNEMDFDLFWHIDNKLKYNQLREFKHGKKY